MTPLPRYPDVVRELELKRRLSAAATNVLEARGYSDSMIKDAKREAWWWLEARGGAASRRRGLLAGVGVVWTDVGRAELMPIEVPRPGPQEVAVEIVASVVSPGTERAQFLMLPNTDSKPPFRPGYSAAGIVREVGRRVKDIRAGDRVAVAGAPHASIATVSVERVFAVPEGVDLGDAALVQLGAIAAVGVRRAQLEQGGRVCVIGAGIVGLLAQRLARVEGAGETFVVARTRRRENIARAGGAHFIATADDEQSLDSVGASTVIDATGDPEALELALRSVVDRGRIVILGSPRGTTSNMPLRTIFDRGLHLVGAHVENLDAERPGLHREESQAFLASLANGSLSVDGLVEIVADPREPDVLYRELVGPVPPLAARFDWTVLAPSDRVTRATIARIPRLRARGMEARRTPLPPSGGRGASLLAPEDHDPFADAAGSLRIGLLGCGDIAILNAAAVVAAPNAHLTACFDPVAVLAEDLAEAYDAKAFPSAEALLASADVDAVWLSVPHHLHAPLAVAAAEAGKHVIVEKPPANDLAGAVEIVEAAERSGVVLSVCFPQRYQPGVVAAKRLIDAGALGLVSGSTTRFLADKPPSYWLGGFSGRAISDWRSSRAKAGGGVLIMNLSHYLDLARHLSGLEAELVHAVTGAHAGAEVEDTVSISFSYENGAVGSVFGSAALPGNRGGLSELALWGTEGYVAVEPTPEIYTRRAIAGLRTGRWQSFGPLPQVDIRAVFMSRFATAVARNLSPDITPADALAVQAFVEAAYRSMESGTGIRPTDLLAQVARR
jgi:2-desacetyl-2-hydroxyethyl bacteriochlorophyllide A dehydrogenase